jgi:hypothetical protein
VGKIISSGVPDFGKVMMVPSFGISSAFKGRKGGRRMVAILGIVVLVVNYFSMIGNSFVGVAHAQAQEEMETAPIGTRIELEDKRTKDSKLFLEKVGKGQTQFRLETSVGSLHYKDDEGKYRDIDLELGWNESQKIWENKTNNYKTVLNGVSDNGYIAAFEGGGTRIEIWPTERQQRKKIVPESGSKNEVKYKNFYDDFDLQFKLGNDRVTSNFIIEHKRQVDRVELEMRVPVGVELRLEDRQINIYKSGELVGRLDPPTMREINRSERKSFNKDGVDYELRKIVEGRYVVAKVINELGKTWLSDRDRLYPIAIDPTINLQVGASADDAYMKDITNNSGRSVSVSGTCSITSTELSPGSHGSNDEWTVAARFTSITIANAATISSATFTLTPQATYNAGSNVVKFHVSAHAADNSTTYSAAAACLNTTNRPRSTADSGPWTQTSVTVDVGQSTSATSVVQEIINRAGWASGNALSIIIDTHTDTTQAEWQDYYAWDHATGAAPKLDITYTDPVPENLTMIFGLAFLIPLVAKIKYALGK